MSDILLINATDRLLINASDALLINHAGSTTFPKTPALSRATQIKFSNHYGPEGSGYGYLTFMLPRQIGLDYSDIGFGYRIIMRKGIRNVLFDGMVTKIDEMRGQDGDQIMVNCLGWNSILAFEPKNFVLVDTRLNRWLSSETAAGSFQPEKIDRSTSWEVSGDRFYGIQMKPRRNVDFEEDDYSYMRYTFEFGESPARITYDWEIALPYSWPGKLELRDDSGEVLHSETATGSGSEDITITTATSYVEFRFYVTDAGENTAEDDTVYMRVTDLSIFSTSDTVDMARVAEEINDHMRDNFGFEWNARLEATGYTLPQAAFDTDLPMSEILTWAASFGGENYAPLAWGIEFNESKRLFVESQDLTTVKYVIPRSATSDASVSGDWTQSAQKVYGVLQSEAGMTERTDTYSADDRISELGDMYRTEAIQLGNITPEQADQAVQYYLEEKSRPLITSSFTINGPVQNSSGGMVPLDEIQAGGIVQVEEFRAREAVLGGGDERVGYTSFMLVGVEIDLESNTATLIPAGDRSRFQKYMAKLSQITKGF